MKKHQALAITAIIILAIVIGVVIFISNKTTNSPTIYNQTNIN